MKLYQYIVHFAIDEHVDVDDDVIIEHDVIAIVLFDSYLNLFRSRFAVVADADVDTC